MRDRRLLVARSVRDYPAGGEVGLPRGVLVAGGRIVRLLDPDRRHHRRELAGVPVDDLADSVVMPGFVDAHNHQPTAARDVGTVRTAHVTSLDALRGVIAAATAGVPPGTWVATEHSLTVSQLDRRDLPVARDLDGAAPDHPVAVRFGAHTMVLNTPALVASGIAAMDDDPVRGLIDRDDAGRPTGPVREYGAIRLLAPHLELGGDPVARLRSVQDQYATAGVTTVRVPGLRPGDVPAYRSLLQQDGRLGTRILGGPRLDPNAKLVGKLAVLEEWGAAADLGGPWLCADAVKVFVDGGVETALAGVEHLFLEPAELAALVAAATDRGWSVAAHAITPRAVGMALDAFAAVVPTPGVRRSVEHGFLARPEHLRRAAELGVWLSTQPAVAQLERLLLDSARSAGTGGTVFPLRSALSLGVRCALGSDWNATPGTSLRPFLPLETVRIATGRHPRDGFPEDETIDIAQALHLHTRAAAALGGCRDRGALRPGALADLAVLTSDPVTELDSCRVRDVVVGGRRRGAGH